MDQVTLPSRSGNNSDESGQLNTVPEGQEPKDPDMEDCDRECDDANPGDAGEALVGENSRAKSTPKATDRRAIHVAMNWCWKAAILILLIVIAVNGNVATPSSKIDMCAAAAAAAAAVKAVHADDSASGRGTAASVGNVLVTTPATTIAAEPKPQESPSFRMVKFSLNTIFLPTCKSSDSSGTTLHHPCRDNIWIRMILSSAKPTELGPLRCLSNKSSFATDQGGCRGSDDFYRLTADGIEILQAGYYHVAAQITAHRMTATSTESVDQSAAASKPVAITLNVNEAMEVSHTARSVHPATPDEGDITANLSAWLWLSVGNVVSVRLQIPSGMSLLGLKISTKAAETFVQLLAKV